MLARYHALAHCVDHIGAFIERVARVGGNAPDAPCLDDESNSAFDDGVDDDGGDNGSHETGPPTLTAGTVTDVSMVR